MVKFVEVLDGNVPEPFASNPATLFISLRLVVSAELGKEGHVDLPEKFAQRAATFAVLPGGEKELFQTIVCDRGQKLVRAAHDDCDAAGVYCWFAP